MQWSWGGGKKASLQQLIQGPIAALFVPASYWHLTESL